MIQRHHLSTCVPATHSRILQRARFEPSEHEMGRTIRVGPVSNAPSLRAYYAHFLLACLIGLSWSLLRDRATLLTDSLALALITYTVFTCYEMYQDRRRRGSMMKLRGTATWLERTEMDLERSTRDLEQSTMDLKRSKIEQEWRHHREDLDLKRKGLEVMLQAARIRAGLED